MRKIIGIQDWVMFEWVSCLYLFCLLIATLVSIYKTRCLFIYRTPQFSISKVSVNQETRTWSSTAIEMCLDFFFIEKCEQIDFWSSRVQRAKPIFIFFCIFYRLFGVWLNTSGTSDFNWGVLHILYYVAWAEERKAMFKLFKSCDFDTLTKEYRCH